MTDDIDDYLEKFTVEALYAADSLQASIWGVARDFTQPSLDYSRKSLVTLALWLQMGALGRTASPSDVVGRYGAQYLGAVIQEHALAFWERGEGDHYGLCLPLRDVAPRHIELTRPVAQWLEAMRRGDTFCPDVFVRSFDAATAGALPPVTMR